VRVGLRTDSSSIAKAEASGLRVLSIADACAEADVIMVLVPDTEQKRTYDAEIAPISRPAVPALRPRLQHSLRSDQAAATSTWRWSREGSRHLVRRTYLEGGGVPALVAVQQDATGHAHDIASRTRRHRRHARRVLETTFTEETETDLFGEQAVLCGGVSALVRAGYETLVEAGYSPRVPTSSACTN